MSQQHYCNLMFIKLSEAMTFPKRFVGTYQHTCSHTDILLESMTLPERFVGTYLHTCRHTIRPNVLSKKVCRYGSDFKTYLLMRW